MFGTKEWEKAASSWWDAALRDPSNLSSLGDALGGMCEAKERSDRMLERMWAHWRLPSAADVERLGERMAEIERQLARIEEALLASAANQEEPTTPAGRES